MLCFQVIKRVKYIVQWTLLTSEALVNAAVNNFIHLLFQDFAACAFQLTYCNLTRRANFRNYI